MFLIAGVAIRKHLDNSIKIDPEQAIIDQIRKQARSRRDIFETPELHSEYEVEFFEETIKHAGYYVVHRKERQIHGNEFRGDEKYTTLYFTKSWRRGHSYHA